MNPMRIGVNALYLIPGGVGGTEIYLRNLLAGLAEVDRENEYVVFTNLETGRDLVPERPNFAWAPQPVHAANRPWRISWELTGLAIAVARRGIDVLLNPGFTSPLLSSCPMVTVFHDLQHKRHPEYFRWFDLPFWRLLLWGSAHRATRIIAVSDATRRDVLDCYKLEPEKVVTVPHGVEARFFRIERSPRSLVLCVSTLHPHKNLERLIRAFGRFRQTRPEYRLVIAGLRGFHAESLDQLVASLGLADSVRLTGWIPREELFTLYESASAFVYPSTFEGFGMPILEALAAGVPTGCSAIEPLLSVAGEAALWFAPDDEQAIANAIERLTSDEPLRQKLSEAGRKRAAEFSWEKTAQVTLAVIAASLRAESSRRS